MHLRLHNTLTKRVEDFVPIDATHITFYSCGPTVYDDAHIGNFRSFLAADVLRRFVESPLCTLRTNEGSKHDGSTQTSSTHDGPRRVTHVMNITDVGHMTDDAEGGETGEDKMAVAGRRLLEAKKAGTLPAGVEVNPSDPHQIARFYEARFKEDARQLGLKLAIEAVNDPSLMPRATESIQGMIAVIARLIEGNYAYVVGEAGSRVVYFDVRTFPTYGSLSGNTLDALKEGEGGRISATNQAQKRSPADFLLWKEDRTHVMKWMSPWGEGYPGWHIECTAMSIARLLTNSEIGHAGHAGHAAHAGSVHAESMQTMLAHAADLTRVSLPTGSAIIDLHSGGEDNIFPHHECEIAQSCCGFTGGTGSFARTWFHPRFLLVEGTKMSKSKGNFFTARDLFAKGIEPAAVRLELIRTHYRANANFTMQGLDDCRRMVERWRRVVDAHPVSLAHGYHADAASTLDSTREHPLAREFAYAMHEDLNVAQAVAAVNGWLNTLGVPTRADSDVLRMIDGVLGVLELERPKANVTEIAAYAPGVTPDPKIEELLTLRRDARAKKDFVTSDRIRDELEAMGLAIKDSAGGKVDVRRA